MSTEVVSKDAAADYKLIVALSNEIVLFENNISNLLAASNLSSEQKLNVWKMIQNMADKDSNFNL
jgi:hypothetical protein